MPVVSAKRMLVAAATHGYAVGAFNMTNINGTTRMSRIRAFIFDQDGVNEDLSMADLIVNCLGEADGPHAEARPGGRRLALADGCVHARDLVALFSDKETNP